MGKHNQVTIMLDGMQPESGCGDEQRIDGAEAMGRRKQAMEIAISSQDQHDDLLFLAEDSRK